MTNYKVKLMSGKTVERYMASPAVARNEAQDMVRRNDAWKGSRWSGGGDKFTVGMNGTVAGAMIVPEKADAPKAVMSVPATA